MAKNLDGIKKIDREEAEKYRRIVLDYIGENDGAKNIKKEKAVSGGQAGRKSVDGVNTAKTANGEEYERKKMAEALKRQEEERKKVKEEEKRFILEKERAEKERLLKEQEKIKQEKAAQVEKERQAKELIEREKKEKEQKIRQEELERKRREEKARLEAEEKERIEQEKIRQEKAEIKEKARLEKEKIKQARQLEKIKADEEKARIKMEKKRAKKIAREAARLKRRQAFDKFKKNLKNKLRKILSWFKNNIIYILVFLLVASALFYVAYCVAVLRFNKYDILKDKIGYLPVPAVITTVGIINYDDFQNIDKSVFLNKKENLVEWLVRDNLAKKYGSADGLEVSFMKDNNYNQSGFSRIKKISELLKKDYTFEQLGKYADEYKSGTYLEKQSAVDKFGSEILNLAPGQTSDIIFGPDGYYIAKRISDGNGQLGYDYLFIKSYSLKQYLNDKLKRAGVFIIAD